MQAEPKRGRPKAEVDESLLEKLCEIQCTQKEMAYVLGVSTDTLNRNYSEAMERGRAMGKLALRRAQWQNAVENNNVTMQIWLGKNILGQSDNPGSEDSAVILPWSDDTK